MEIRNYSDYVGHTDQNPQLFWLECGNRFFTTSLFNVLEAEYHLNRNFTLSGYATLNEFYDFLRIPRDDDGDDREWSASLGYGWIDFEHDECTVIGRGSFIAIRTPFWPCTEAELEV